MDKLLCTVVSVPVYCLIAAVNLLISLHHLGIVIPKFWLNLYLSKITTFYYCNVYFHLLF